MHEVWVPTEFHRRTFAASGVQPAKLQVINLLWQQGGRFCSVRRSFARYICTLCWAKTGACHREQQRRLPPSMPERPHAL